MCIYNVSFEELVCLKKIMGLPPIICMVIIVNILIVYIVYSGIKNKRTAISLTKKCLNFMYTVLSNVFGKFCSSF